MNERTNIVIENTDEKTKRTKTIGEKVNIAKKKLTNLKNKKSAKQLKIEKMKAELEALKKEVAKEKKKAINDVIKSVDSMDYKKVLKEIAEISDDNFLLSTIIDFAIAQNKEIKGKFLEINEFIKSNNDKKIYELMGYNDYDEMMKKKEEYELAELEEENTDENLTDDKDNTEKIIEEREEDNSNENLEEYTTGY